MTILLWTAACAVGYAQAKATFDKKVHEFGVVLWKHPATATFTVKNDGNKPLVISNVTTSCGCTIADWTKTPIAPGETGVVKSTFDAKALGHFYKDIGVYCNASDRPIYLMLSGEVSADPKNYTLTHPVEIGAIRLDKDAIEFDDANKGDKPTMEILVANTTNEVYTPVLMHLPPYLEAVAVPERIGKKATGKIKVTLDTDKLPKFGLTTATVYLSRFPGDKVGDDNAIPVSAILLPDLGNYPGIRVLGFMTIPPICHNSGENDKFFQEMYNLSVDITAKKYDNVLVRFLSMGMSDDYTDAIAHGSNMVRIGTAIFGARDYANSNQA